MKTIITATALALFVTSALANDKPSTAKHIACVLAGEAKLSPRPPEQSEKMTKDEREANSSAFSAWVKLETAAFQRCFSEREVRLLAEADYVIDLAVSRCGGVKRNKEVIEFGNMSRVVLFGRQQDATENEYKDTNERMSADPSGPVVARFCQGVIDRFGPKGVEWLGLYSP